MNMFKPVDAKSDTEYIAMLTDDRREAIEAIDTLIQKTVPKLDRWFAYNMLGYGRFQYKNSKKELVDWPVISLASQKNYMSLYVCSISDSGEYVAEEFKDKLGKVSVGKSCIRFKKLDDLNLDAVKEVLLIANKQPGLVYAADKKDANKK